MLVAVGVVPSAVLGLNLIIGAVPRDRAGMAAGLGQSVNELGAALGIGLLGALGAAVFRSNLPGLQSGDNLGVVLESVDQSTRIAAQEAFLDGMHVVAVVAAAALLITAVCMSRLLRDTPAPDLDQATTMNLIHAADAT
jgi:DHA2 family multidrug resistance protein-like MFS transporter